MPTHEEPGAASVARKAAIMELRLGFKLHGFDVDAYGDDQVRKAIVAAARDATDSSKDLFTRAFERLTKSQPQSEENPTSR